MTELDTVKRAKLYIDQLANGINPFDGTVIPEGEIIHNVRLSRCFFYISRILQQVVDNGGTVTPGEPKKRIPLSIPHQKREQFAYSGTPISASEIARRVNQLAGDENMKKLTYSGIVSWLMDIGLLTRVSAPDGRLTVRPTSLGEENGISVVQRMGANGSYRVVVYDLKAQHFLLDNLDAVIARENALAALQRRPWDPEQDRRLAELHQTGASYGEIAVALQRSTSAIRSRLKKQGLLETK